MSLLPAEAARPLPARHCSKSCVPRVNEQAERVGQNPLCFVLGLRLRRRGLVRVSRAVDFGFREVQGRPRPVDNKKCHLASVEKCRFAWAGDFGRQLSRVGRWGASE